jgi:prephenate dehydrogenase
MSSRFQRIGIVGLGLIGGSIALAIERRWPGLPIVGIDRADRFDDLRRKVPNLQLATDLTALAGADLIVLAAPVRENLALLGQLQSVLHASSLVTDTSSTKRAIVQAAEALPTHLTFIGGHPMAGDVRAGAEHARADLFDGRPWLLTPRQARPNGLQALEALIEGLGARPARIEAPLHDRVLAYVSHLPQLTASALMAVVGSAVDERGLACAGGGLSDTTRLAASAPAIWQDIVGTNADEIGDALDALILSLQELRSDLAGGDTLYRVFRSAMQWREHLLSLHSPQPSVHDPD